MNRISTFLVMGCITVFLISLFACGGGGGGGDSFTPVSYTGNTTLATIDDSNAPDLAVLAESGSSMGTIAPIPVGVTATDGSQAGVPSPVLKTITRLAKNLPGYLQSSSPGTASLAAVNQSETLYCNGNDSSDGSFFIAATWDSAAGTISANMTFSSCDEGFGEVLNGAVSFSMSGIVDDGLGNPDILNSSEVTLSQTYKNLRVYYPATLDTITIYSSMTLGIDKTNPDTVITMNIHDMVMSQQPSGLTARIKNYNLTVIEYPLYNEITISSATVMAEIYDHVLGYVYFYTLAGFPIQEDLDGPYDGIVRMEGANGSWAEIDFSVTCDIPTSIYNGTFNDGTVIGEFCYTPTP